MEDEISLINAVLQNDKYVAEAKLNEGSYGEIFKVKQKSTKQTYALKAMEIQKLQSMNKVHEAALEVAILQNLHHEGVIQLHDIIRNNKYIGLILELCPYGDVFQLMRSVNRHLDLAIKKKKIMIYYLAQILQVIDYLHSKAVIHRDLKPQNIVLGSDLKIRVIDFGTAKVLPEGGLFSGQQFEQIQKMRRASEQQSGGECRKSFVGTSNYLSPQSIDLQFSFKSDIWAFGILAYKFYFNRLPYEGQDSIEIFKKIKLNDLPLQEHVEPEFQELFRLTLCKDPQLRPSVAELKRIKLFEGIDFKQIFKAVPPISKMQLSRVEEQEVVEKPGTFLFEWVLQKRMFFGNYKPRLLTISRVGGRLMMAYRYVGTKKIKNEFQLNLNDYAIVLKGNEFEVVTTDKRYRFRLTKNQSPQQPVQQINAIIRKGYSLS